MVTNFPVFTTSQLARYSQNTPKRVERWIEHGLLIPATPASGTRTRMFSTFALFEASRLGLLTNAGLDLAQLRDTSTVIHERILATVKPEAGFDLFARAGYGFLIETVQALQKIRGSNNAETNAWVKAATRRLKNKANWRLEYLCACATAPDDDVAIVVPGLAPTAPAQDKSRVSALV